MTGKQRRVLIALAKLGKYDAPAIMKMSRVKTVSELESIVMELFNIDFVDSVMRNYRSEITSVSLNTSGKHYKDFRTRVVLSTIAGYVAGVITSAAGSYLYELIKTTTGK